MHPEDRIRSIAEFREALELPTFWAEMQRQSVELGALRSHSGTTGFGALAELGDDDAAPSDLGPATLPPPEERAMPAAAPRRPRPDAAERARTPAERPRPPAPATRSGTPPAPHAAGAAARARPRDARTLAGGVLAVASVLVLLGLAAWRPGSDAPVPPPPRPPRRRPALRRRPRRRPLPRPPQRLRPRRPLPTPSARTCASTSRPGAWCTSTGRCRA
ncbi:hypothetical protein H0I39_03485 [Ottowia beijingensis]|uniref:Uncharacterized protein n=1 Tax=Ottowia beijingensis TaxID=1207057 RepID=A0A853ITM2_9BURK|nr:hypothetical protein [Ottowia beijingensis]NZA01061.1 hypothetical protein [Ottowia beijingensis]